MIVWLNGTHSAGMTMASALVQQLIPDSRVFDAEKVGETPMNRGGTSSADQRERAPS